MATIPIEIILQDAEVPVDPTPTPEETNIVVPDTGAGTIGNNTFSSSSAASIILPAILLVAALATVCTLLIHKHRKCQDNDKFSKKEKLLTATSATIAVLSATVLVGNLIIPVTSAATSVEPGTAELDTVDKITITATREIDSGITVATVKNTSYATANLDFGYKVTASMAKGTTAANLYLDGNTDSPYYIAPVVDGTLADNTWGYTLSEPTEESSYQSIPLSTKPTNIVKEVAKTVEDTAVNMYYTVQIDKDMPNGTYTGELEYTISPAIEYMQDFSTLTSTEKTATLARMAEGKQYTLIDYRGDDKSYYISKLADGNVWMTQNLDLDIDENTTYTHADTDLGWSDPNSLDATAKWKPDEGHSTISFTGGTAEGWVDSRTAPYSADPGDVYYYTSGTDADDTKYDSLADCERDHKDGSCPHYHAGNYYNWSAAVASNDTSGMITKYDNAPNSICPAGWRLPIGRNSDSEATGDFYILLDTQGDIFGERTPWGSGFWFTDGGLNTIRNNPLWFVRSGFILEFLQNDSVESKYWSSTVAGSSAYQLIFDDTGVSPANSNISKEIGISIRCMMQ